ncbi:hypothetical protein Q361_102108 [Flavobacterium croceum DSM 17960]|uniref:Uncharacterized protein n=2 Tax=Flavobacterium TaxID=237 RepID=A0A2S4NAT9_9FLAO|nr:hypothetical protein Q361_102108 [Flavobacterium croceum DSM 17960]
MQKCKIKPTYNAVKNILVNCIKIIFMKKYIVYLFIGVSLISCSSESSDTENTNNDPGTTTTFLPLNNGNYWTYNVNTSATSTSPATSGRDSLYIANDTIINSITYKKPKTLALPFGFYSSALRNNGIRINGSKLLLTGAISTNLGIGNTLQFDVNDFCFFKENGTQGELLSSKTGSFTQTYNGYPLNFNYVLSSYSDGSLASFTAPTGTTYTNVKKSKLVLNLTVTTTVSGLTGTLLNAQDVMTSNQYYVSGKGMVYTSTNLGYQLNPLAANLNLGIPTSQTQTQTENLHSFYIH